MHYKVIAIDLDGTIAKDGIVASETFKLFDQAKKAGFALLLVTGRRLEVLPDIGPFEDWFEAIIAENGATIYYPANEQVILPFGTVDDKVTKQLEAVGIPIEKGMAIIATWRPHDEQVLKVLSQTGYAATVEHNKGAVMVLPPGASKGTALRVALQELGYSARNLLVVGDAENDRSMFNLAELSIAVSNAVPEIKDIADIVLDHPRGAGVRTFINQLISGKTPRHRSRAFHSISLGKTPENQPVLLAPTNFVDNNLAIIGESGSGKSWLAGLLVENLLKLNYQVCIIDPEGDYRGLRSFPHTMLIGGVETEPLPVVDVLTIYEYTDLNIILDLSLYTLEKQQKYVYELLFGLSSLKAQRGKPHWVLIDEIQYFCPTEGSTITDLILDHFSEGGITIVSYRPALVAPLLLQRIDHWLFTRLELADQIEVLKTVFSKREGITTPDWSMIPKLTTKQVYLSMGNTAQIDAPASGILNFDASRRIVPHVRHLHKYLRAPLPSEKRFYFFINNQDDYQGPLSAASLWEFNKIIGQLPTYCLEYHMDRKDFEQWTSKVLHDQELARRINKINRKKLRGTALQDALKLTVSERFNTLEKLI